ncbi:unnamed protein product [Oncorhynchus mykiss]|uniref:dUTP diphosphatase n=1 Tax=Oncorhynchus mykiss TaxID=8022 RepID=A0A060YA57_ONCMY|nr:unnamed protein product [Oncorhynchus mykiss]
MWCIIRGPNPESGRKTPDAAAGEDCIFNKMEHFVAKQRLYWRCCSSIIAARSSVLSHRTFYLYSPTLARRKGCENAEVIDAAEVSPLKRTKPHAVAENVISVLKFSKLSEHATAPTRGSAKAAGYDLFSAYDYSIGPMDKAIVKTDIQIAVPSGCYGRICFPVKHCSVGKLGDLWSDGVSFLKKGDRVAQLVCERICYPDLQELKTLDETERGAGGFGSTGSN